MRARRQRHYLYVIAQGDSGPCKVGISQKPRQRLAALQTASPHKLKLYEVWYFANGEQIEAESLAHASLCDCPLSGEWFDCGPEKAIERINLYFCWWFALEGVEGIVERNFDVRFGMFKNGWVTESDRRVLP
jgi:hypothetical protein